jgi:hypothetical protein
MGKFNETTSFIYQLSGKRMDELYTIPDSDIELKNKIVEHVLLELTGNSKSVYRQGLVDKMFKKSFDYEIEWSWMQNDSRRNKFTSQLHSLYYTLLGRCCDLSTITKCTEFNIVDIEDIEMEIKSSIEYYYYQKISSYESCGFEEHPLNDIIYSFWSCLYYMPQWYDLKNIEYKKVSVKEYVSDMNDFKYLEACRCHFTELSKSNKQFDMKKNCPTIVYYGPVGTSGYAKMTRDIVNSLYNANINVIFRVSQFHNYSMGSNVDPGDILLSLLSNIERPTGITRVIIHSMPNLFPVISKYEYSLNVKVVLYGITVWETETLPPKWALYSSYMDKISVPSIFSGISFEKVHTSVDVINHPIISTGTDYGDVPCMMKDKEYDYIYYNISEWSNRKGIIELLHAFYQTCILVGNGKRIALYLKTFGIDKNDAMKFVNLTCREYSKHVYLDFERVTDLYINCIHNCCDCYVSLTKSEGHGIGACYAALFENHVIITKYSGQLDYLVDVDFISWESEPATLCSIDYPKKHSKCKNLPHCIHFDAFIPAFQSWAKPNIKEASEKMHKVALSSKKGEYSSKMWIIHNYNSIVFAERLLNSLETTCSISLDVKNNYIQKYSILDTSGILQQSLVLDYSPSIKKRILVCNSAGYGNVGDDSYNWLLKKFFCNYDIQFVPDTQILLSDGKIKNIIHFKSDNDVLWEFDYLVIGGGGLLRNVDNIQKTSMFFYQKLCVKRSIPYYIISVGFQDCSISTSLSKHLTEIYKDLLCHSQYTSVRSIHDYHFINTHFNISCKYYPDMIYAVSKYIPYKNVDRNIIMVILSDTWITLTDFIVDYIRESCTPSDQLIFIDFGGIQDGKTSCINTKRTWKLFPDSQIYHGIKLEWNYDHDHITNDAAQERLLSLPQVYDLLYHTRILITSRYHGLVLGKVFQVPVVETFGYSNYKFTADILSNHQRISATQLEILAITPLQDIRNCIDNDVIFTHRSWNDDQRNTAIVEINNKTGIDISMLQNWNNDQLESRLLD